MKFLGDFSVFEDLVMLKIERFDPRAWEEDAMINYLSRVEQRVIILAILIRFGIVLMAVLSLLALHAPTTEGNPYIGALQASRLYSPYLHSL